MEYFSLNKNAPRVSFKEAVIRGLAPDKGLYFPSEINPLSKEFIDNIQDYDPVTVAFEVIKQFVGDDIPEEALKNIIHETLSFDFPLVPLGDKTFSLELYHGPTLAFKDVGARFMARCLGYFNSQDAQSENVTVLVATSGDTGGAVASGFFKVPGVEVVILYPSGKVSDIQEKQLTTFGENIAAVEVEGTFDDCQAMVKRAFLDEELIQHKKLTSANSINVARWLPQMFYYFMAYRALAKRPEKIVMSVPSGNFGNICAGMMAQKLGLPIHHFVSGTNANRVVPEFLASGNYDPKPSVATISNAMDVGAPSNFVRIREIYDNNFDVLKSNLTALSYSDEQTEEAIRELYNDFGYIADPHGAIGYLAAREYQKSHSDDLLVFLETAHPVKFRDVIPSPISEAIQLPESILSILPKKKKAEFISTYSQLKSKLIN